MDLETIIATIDLVARSDWTTILPGCICLPDIERQVRKLHAIVHPQLTVDYILVAPNTRIQSPAAKRFVEKIRDEIRGNCVYFREKLLDTMPAI